MKHSSTIEQRKRIKALIAQRQAQINHLEESILKPLRDGNKRLKECLTGECNIKHEVENQERLSAFIQGIFKPEARTK